MKYIKLKNRNQWHLWKEGGNGQQTWCSWNAEKLAATYFERSEVPPADGEDICKTCIRIKNDRKIGRLRNDMEYFADSLTRKSRRSGASRK